MTDECKSCGPCCCGGGEPTQAEKIKLADAVETSEGSIVSRPLLENTAGTLTLFAFDAGQGLSEHTAPFDAVAQIIEGEAELTIGGETYKAAAGDLIVMPANVPHAVKATAAFKMLLTMLRAG